jgi:hypothetical protein
MSTHDIKGLGGTNGYKATSNQFLGSLVDSATIAAPDGVDVNYSAPFAPQLAQEVQAVIKDAVAFMDNIMDSKMLGANTSPFKAVPCGLTELADMYKTYMLGGSPSDVDDDEALAFAATDDLLKAVSLFELGYDESQAQPRINDHDRTFNKTTATSNPTTASIVPSQWEDRQFRAILDLPSPSVGELFQATAQCLRDIRAKEKGE